MIFKNAIFEFLSVVDEYAATASSKFDIGGNLDYFLVWTLFFKYIGSKSGLFVRVRRFNNLGTQRYILGLIDTLVKGLPTYFSFYRPCHTFFLRDKILALTQVRAVCGFPKGLYTWKKANRMSSICG